MSDAESLQADYTALNDLIVKCQELETLERLLGGFNLFQVLKFEYGELRHSNVLGWIMDPAESHGLDETFLKKWLMRVLYDFGSSSLRISAIDIDAWQLHEVEVRREWRNIDLLLILHFIDGSRWTICIENKVNSSQHSGQLTRYRKIVEQEFGDSKQKLYLFLTKNPEEAEDDHYIQASYTQVQEVLSECLAARVHTIGIEPRALLDSYIRLLEEKFMDQSEIARIAQLIYKQHRRALEVLFEHRPDVLQDVSNALRSALERKAQILGICMAPCSKGFVRFYPKEWDQPWNHNGSTWTASNITVLFEITFRTGVPNLIVVAGKGPEPLIDAFWKLSQKPPFVRKKNKAVRPKHAFAAHNCGHANFSIEDPSDSTPDEIAEQIINWVSSRLNHETTKEIVNKIKEELCKHGSLHTPTVDS